jgi:hypothetical protein
MRSAARPPSPLSDKPTVILTGAFGSGKTEIAINYAVAAGSTREMVVLVDLDVVTPYFRVGDYRQQLENQGIQVVAAEGGLASFEVPALSPRIVGALQQEDAHLVIDAGGDPVGARLLRLYADQVSARGYDMWLVVNPFRPSSSSADSVASQAGETEDQSGLRLTGIVANPNLALMTDPADVRRGWTQIGDAARRLGLPVVFLAARAELLEAEELAGVPVLPLQITVRMPWQPP